MIMADTEGISPPLTHSKDKKDSRTKKGHKADVDDEYRCQAYTISY